MIIIIDIILFLDDLEKVVVAYGEYSQVGSKYHFYEIDEFIGMKMYDVGKIIRESSDYINKIFIFDCAGNLCDILGVNKKCLKHNTLKELKRVGKKKETNKVTEGITLSNIVIKEKN